MKYASLTTILASCCLCLALSVSAQVTAAQWAEANKDKLDTITDATMADLLDQGKPALENLFSTVKTAGASDPVESTRIAAITQYVMRPAGTAKRKMYTDALLAAAQQATDADVIAFFLYQLRWCGLPEQAKAIQAFEKSDKPGVSQLASMTVQAVTDDRSSKATPVADNTYAAFNKKLSSLEPQALTAHLLKAFDGPDNAIAGIALEWAQKTKEPKETALWMAKLSSTTDPARKTMLIDMLGNRGDQQACEGLATLLTDADSSVANSAQRALIRLSPSAFASHLPVLLKDIPGHLTTIILNNARLLPTELLKPALLNAYETFNNVGKKLAMDLFKERHITEASKFALASLDAKDENTVIAAYRLLRDTADASHANLFFDRLTSANGKLIPEIQSAIATAARRDNTGAYAPALVKAIQSATPAARPVLLETAARIGGAELLKSVEAASSDSDAAASTAAVRALAAWPDDAAVPALLRLAATAPDAKRQILASRGIARLAKTATFDKNKWRLQWQELRKDCLDTVRRDEIDRLFAN